MAPDFYSLGMILNEYFGRVASALREPELRRLGEFLRGLSDEENR